MSPLAKQVIDTLAKEEDTNLLAEVLDFYDYLKEKKKKILDEKWKAIDEDEATLDEHDIIKEYESKDNNDMLSLHELTKELNLNE